ncbi:tetratricopeptide repeat protein, partial [Polaribacter sp.]|nr:tetratricopeptide repeat protein [Polaribacter sp.]
EDSNDFKKNYYKIETYLFQNCESLKSKIAVYEEISSKSLSNKPKALKFYAKGIDENEKQNFKKAIKFFKKAVSIDENFAFAWDNLGITYRKLNNFDKAIESYEKSLEIDPYGKMPLQNIAVTYQYKKDYKKAIQAYERLANIDENNPEIYYGLGQIYSLNFENYEKGLDYMCKAYTLYTAQKSPYRVDAEKIINIIHSKMKEQNQTDEFDKILIANKISQ